MNQVMIEEIIEKGDGKMAHSEICPICNGTGKKTIITDTSALKEIKNV